MLSILALAAAASVSPPVQAKLVSVERREGGTELSGGFSHRLNVELTSAEGGVMDLCPEAVSVTGESASNGSLAPVRSAHAYAMRLGSDYWTSCRTVSLAPHQPQVVTFFVRPLPSGRDVERFVTAIDVAGARFELAQNALTYRQVR